jgi:hypothetical protein
MHLLTQHMFSRCMCVCVFGNWRHQLLDVKVLLEFQLHRRFTVSSEMLALLLCICKAAGSNLILATAHLRCVFHTFPSGKFLGGALNQATTASSHMYPIHYYLILSFNAILSELPTAS